MKYPMKLLQWWTTFFLMIIFTFILALQIISPIFCILSLECFVRPINNTSYKHFRSNPETNVSLQPTVEYSDCIREIESLRERERKKNITDCIKRIRDEGSQNRFARWPASIICERQFQRKEKKIIA